MSLSEFQIIAKLGIVSFICKTKYYFLSIKNLIKLFVIGDGSYSQVYKVKRIEDAHEYALKKVKMINLSDREKENALNEVRILASIKHKNVAAYK